VPSLHFVHRTSIQSSIDLHHEPITLLQDLLNGNGSIPIELVMYVPTYITAGGTYWLGTAIYTTDGHYFLFGINTYSSNRGLMVGFPLDATATAATGFKVLYTDGNKVVSFVSTDVDERRRIGLHHLAVVIDRTRSETRGYIDGVLAGTMNTASYNLSSIMPYNSLNPTILMTQFAIFSADRSTNNGATYPVPAKPYSKF
jgi:hypothetical protein